jgi:hypothetical protein
MHNTSKKPRYALNPQGEFIVENYNLAKPFANFFPGIAGTYGIPMWAFYVNRGQAIASFGTTDKNSSILEFFPANKAWQLVSHAGFRTFFKIAHQKGSLFYEPFHNGLANLHFEIDNRMSISSHGLKIEESNSTVGLHTKVEYFTIPNDSFAALARIVTIRNTSRSVKHIQILDGLPTVIPFGIANLFLKKLGRTIEAWMKVKNIELGVPFYKIDVDPTDRPQVLHVMQGNFYLGFSQEAKAPRIIRPIVDPQCVFGPITDLSFPYQFFASKNYQYPKTQISVSKTPCAFVFERITLAPSEEKTLYTVIGSMDSLETLTSCVPRIAHKEYLREKQNENRRVIEDLQKDIDTKSAYRAFDLYAKQTYLDNIIRGGYPLIFGKDKSRKVFYAYSRKHGDLERDYNKFHIESTYFSQGNGNYRDMNQNRRCDIWFHPEVDDENIILFFNLIQSDGFNPLVIKGCNFILDATENFKIKLDKLTEQKYHAALLSFLEKPFTPGSVILFIEKNKIRLRVNYEQFLNTLITSSFRYQEAEHGEGFWTDHWTYNLDLLENYLAIFPERLKELVFDKRVFAFYDNTESVKPRDQKYILKDNTVRQFHSLVSDSAKRELIKKRVYPHELSRNNHGNADVYTTTLVNKLFCILVNKMASLDPFGVGMEMEADKPNWFDALNGLPALLGSSINETFELKRLLVLIGKFFTLSGVHTVALSEEIYELLEKLDSLASEYFTSPSKNRDLDFWDKSHTLKEEYRHKTKFGFSGKEAEVAVDALKGMLANFEKKVDAGLEKGRDKKRNVYYSYFVNEATKYHTLNQHFVKPTKFSQKKLPLFLEGQMHALRLSASLHNAQLLYRGTQDSELYDKKLKMYKVTASLKGMPEEIGRCRVFTPGWLENESIWLHMEYKYLLEVLKCGLYEEFYKDLRNALIPFQKAEQYGRSILENSSFLVSSAFPDKSLHGNGFVARLSGSTAEFVNMWLLMNIGKTPFTLDSKNRLQLTFSPILAKWLFAKDKTYRFNFLSSIAVTYRNPKMKNTFGKNGVTPVKIAFCDTSGNPVELNSDTIPSPYAQQIRSRAIPSIEIVLS